MDIDLLRTFLEVRRLGNFRAAADNLHVTQAAVSQRIKQLESVMNARLFIREKNNIYVTQAGEQLVGAAETILTTWQNAKSSIGDTAETGPGISLAAPAGVWSLQGYPLLTRFADLHAEMSFRTEIQNEAQILKRLQAQTLDLALLVTDPDLDSLCCVALRAVPLSLQARGKHRVQDLKAKDFVAVDWGKPVRLQLSATIALRGTPRISASDHLIAENFISASGGVALLPEPPPRGLRTVEGSPRLHCTVYALWHRRNPLQALIAGLFDAMKAPEQSVTEPVN